MTAKFDEASRSILRQNYVPFDFSGVKPTELAIKKIDCKTARGYIATFHYSRTMPDSSRFVFGAFYGERIVGVCVFGMGCGKNQYTSVFPDIENGQYIELTRMWMEDTLGKNSESYFISKCLKMLPKCIKLVVSFSDEKQNHVGYIYQATNFLYIGKNNGGKMLIDSNGFESHPRLLGIYRMRHEEYKNYSNEQLMHLLGYKYVESGAKHKYIYIRDKAWKKKLKCEILPYPKKTLIKHGIGGEKDDKD